MKVYVCWSIPDYIGIDVEAIFDTEEKAKAFCDEHNKNVSYEIDRFGYDEYEVK